MPKITAEQFNQRGAGKLPGHLGVVITLATPEQMRGEFQVQGALILSTAVQCPSTPVFSTLARG